MSAHNYGCTCGLCVEIRQAVIENTTIVGGNNIREAQTPPAATSYQPQVGDRVRIVLEGTVGSSDMEGIREWGIDSHAWGGRNVVSVEKLEAAEPTWRRGDVVVCADHAGGPFVRTKDADWINGNGDRDSLTGCSVTLLVRDGETVAADKK